MTRATASAVRHLTLLWPLLFLSAGAAAQVSYKSGIDVAAFTVTVVDRAGAPIADLKLEDFEVREDGVPQNVSYFSTGSGEHGAPLHIGLLFDTSESMEKDLAFSSGAAIRFLNMFPEAADFTLVEFDTQVRAARFSQSEFPRLVSRIRNRKAKGRTALFDAMSVYLGSAFDQTGKKVVVVYTDGGDTSSSRTWPEALRILRAADVTVYPIGFMAHQGSGRMMQQNQLLEIARLTGGLAAFPSAMKDLEGVYARIASEIHAQYLVGYVSTNTKRNGEWRKVDIRLKRPPSERLQLRTRQGYFAPAK
jgi:Ca-activated chloride channel homolog